MKNFLTLIGVVVVAVIAVGVLANVLFVGMHLLAFVLKYLLLPAVLVAAGVYAWRKLTAKM